MTRGGRHASDAWRRPGRDGPDLACKRRRLPHVVDALTVTWYRLDRARALLTLELRVQPNASRSEFAGCYGNRLKVRIAAPAVDDMANSLLIDFLRKTFNLPAGKVIIKRGSHSRSKTVEISGADDILLAKVSQLADR